MRREKTLKLCANHFILPWMELKKNANSEKAWVWKTQVGHVLVES
jgi:Ran-binding protein 1